jgi:predicted small metal-binding protein
MKNFVCNRVNPGCDAVFEGSGDQSVLDQVLVHAAAEHGISAPTLPFIELVMTHTLPGIRTRGHLRLVGSE